MDQKAKKNKKIAITGGIGSGKTLALQYLREWGYPVFSCDEIYKEIIVLPAYIEKIAKEFPDCILNGKIDRRTISDRVFSNPQKLQKLNQIAHPIIMEKLLSDMEKHEGLVFAEVPLLFEGNFENLFDGIIVLKRKEEKRIDSVISRDCTTEEKIRERINAQFDYNSKEGLDRLNKCAAVILENNGATDDLKNHLKNLLKKSGCGTFFVKHN